ncbi:MAG: hypothetical protein DRI69_03530 [Bacteroidetes bacterium]|nr:MAG: hypothetical protein DRI69_03530 [Bacteroidota bacterium]
MDKILIAFANSKEDELQNLRKEDEELNSLLVRALSDYYTIIPDSNATKDSLGRKIRENEDDICLFLYSGHAGSDELLLDDKKAGADGLAALLGGCPKLKLVFLNGCNTKGHVERLQEVGVPVIIATNDFIGDEKAFLFSTVFFEKLASLSTIERAFEEAKKAVWSDERNIDIHRGLSGDWLTGGNKEDDLWGLFTSTEKEEVLKWKLKRATVVDPNFEPNVLLRNALVEGLAKYSKDARRIVENEANGDICSDRKKQNIIFDALLEPIGNHFGKLMINESENSVYSRLGLGRLRQLLFAYNAMTELIALVFMSQLWELAAKESIELTEEELNKIRQFLVTTEKGSEKFDYTRLIHTVRLILSRYGVEYFVSELEELSQAYEENTELKEGVGFLEDVKSQLVDGAVTENDAAPLCALAEKSLATFVKETGFLSNYDLMSIKRVDVYKYRHIQKARFKYKYATFEQSSGGPGDEIETRSFIMDDQSVLITKPDSDGEYLNLSPFVIDENAFDEMASLDSLLAFRFYDQSTGIYHFKSFYRPKDPLEEIEENGKLKIIADQYEAFAKLIFNKSMGEL